MRRREERRAELDPLKLMNAVVSFAPEDGVKQVAALCEYAAALKALLACRTKMYRQRCQGVVRDTRTDAELKAAANEVDRIEAFFGVQS